MPFRPIPLLVLKQPGMQALLACHAPVPVPWYALDWSRREIVEGTHTHALVSTDPIQRLITDFRLPDVLMVHQLTGTLYPCDRTEAEQLLQSTLSMTHVNRSMQALHLLMQIPGYRRPVARPDIVPNLVIARVFARFPSFGEFVMTQQTYYTPSLMASFPLPVDVHSEADIIQEIRQTGKKEAHLMMAHAL